MAELTCDHVHPVSKGGPHSWKNVVSSCKRCNNRKGSYILGKEIDMELIFVPYEPTYAETLILKNRNILVDQMEFLLHFVPTDRKHLFK